MAVAADRSDDSNGAFHAGELVKQIAPLVGGGGGGSPEVAVAGGKDPAGIDGALDEARPTAGVLERGERRRRTDRCARPGRAVGHRPR